MARGVLDNIISKTMVAWKLFYVFMGLNSVGMNEILVELWECECLVCLCVCQGEWVLAGEKLER